MGTTKDVIPSRAESLVRARPELAEGNLLFLRGRNRMIELTGMCGTDTPVRRL